MPTTESRFDRNRGSSGSRAGGRPRDPRLDAAILDSTRALLVEGGYSALSLSAVAARAGTTTAAIYRRWSGKPELVHDAVLPPDMPVASSATGDLADDVRALFETARDLFTGPAMRSALPGLIADMAAAPELHARVVGRFADAFASIGTRFDGGIAPDLLIQTIGGATMLRVLLDPDATFDDAWVTSMTDLVVNGLANPR